ncbi:hypothetical protein [Amycolatopsis sp. NPDC004079]|uniref:hypothetical protein n=1 Tax=Amycolatopsis sp. NPDC004079 TaxID=3154549 RepID=UPI0033BD3E9F
MTVALAGHADDLLCHLAHLGAAGIAREAGREIALVWSDDSPVIEGISPAELGADVVRHAQRLADRGSWLWRRHPITGRPLMSAKPGRIGPVNHRKRQAPDGFDAGRWSVLTPRQRAWEAPDPDWHAHTAARENVLDELTAQRDNHSLRMISGLGEPASWLVNDAGYALADRGATPLDMQPRNAGAELLGSRLQPLADAVAQRSPAEVADGLTGKRCDDPAPPGRPSRTATGLAPLGAPTDSAIAWCALWGLAEIPLRPPGLAPDLHSDKLTPWDLATPAGWVGDVDGWFILPVWQRPLSLAKVRTLVASSAVRDAGTEGLPERWRAAQRQIARIRAVQRGAVGVVRWPIRVSDSGKAKEVSAGTGETLGFRDAIADARNLPVGP